MFWNLKIKILGVLGKVFFLGIYIVIIIYFEDNIFVDKLKEQLRENTITIPNQVVVYIGLFLYSLIIEAISSSNIIVCPKIDFNFNLHKRQKNINCYYSHSEVANNSRDMIICLEKNFDNIIGKIILFFEKYYFFIIKIKYPQELGIDLTFFYVNQGHLCRKIKKEELIKKLAENYKYIHVKDEYTYYLNIINLGGNIEFENEYHLSLTAKDSLKFSKIQSNLIFYSKNKYAKLFFPIVSILLFLFIKFRPMNIGIVIEEVNS